MIEKRLVVTLDVNPTDVAFSHDVSGVDSMELEYFKMTGVNPLAVPPYIYLKIDGDVNTRADLVVSSTIRQNGTGFVRPSAAMVPLYYKSGPDASILHGKQCEKTRWKMEGLKNMTNFRVTLVGYDGQVLDLDAGVIVQLVFYVKYRDEKTWGDKRTKLQAWT